MVQLVSNRGHTLRSRGRSGVHNPLERHLGRTFTRRKRSEGKRAINAATGELCELCEFFIFLPKVRRSPGSNGLWESLRQQRSPVAGRARSPRVRR